MTVWQNEVFFSLPFWIFFLIFFCLIPWKAVKGSWRARMGLNFDDYPGFQPMRSLANTNAHDCRKCQQMIMVNISWIYLYSFLHMQNEPFDRVWRMTLVVNCQTNSPKYRLESNCKLEKFQHPENKLSLLYVVFWPNILLYTTQTACFTKSKYSLISK